MMESCVPPGYRFHPTDEELVGYYLRKKVASQKIDLDVIKEIDLYRIEPWDLQERCRIGYEDQNEWYFFSHKDKKYPTGTRTNRATMVGFWKATGRDKSVYERTKLIGMRKTLVFYKGRAPNGQKTDWIMHEYRLETVENGPPQIKHLIGLLNSFYNSVDPDNFCFRRPLVEYILTEEEGWVVCRAFKKRTNGQTKTIKGWDRSRLYDEQASIGVNSVVDPVNLVTRQQSQSFSAQNILYKKEMIEADSLSFMHADQLVQHPQLETPSLTLVKNKQTLVSTLVSNQEDWQQRLSNSKKVTDWRDLDKFVASQLSQEERHEIEGVSSFATHTCSDMPLLLLHNSRDNNEGNKLNPFLRTSSADCDIGICVFEN